MQPASWKTLHPTSAPERKISLHKFPRKTAEVKEATKGERRGPFQRP